MAESTLKKAIELKPSYWNNYVRLGTFYFAHSRYKEAADAFQHVTRLIPDNPAGYTNLGVIYHLQGKEVLAEQALTRSLQVRPTVEACSNLATVYFFEGHYADAIPIMETLAGVQNTRVVKAILNVNALAGLGRKDFVVWGNLADAYRWTPSERSKAAAAYERAASLANQALQVNPRNAAVLISIALYNAKVSQKAEALNAAAKALAEAPQDSNVLFNSAVVYAVVGQKDLALTYLAKAVKNGYSQSEIGAEPELKTLREDPRYAVLIRPAVPRNMNGH